MRRAIVHHLNQKGNKLIYSNTTGAESTAIGESALLSNTEGRMNTAVGMSSLSANKTGNEKMIIIVLSIL